eukprot:TRINITY_DN21089_c0_g1_i1.p1 TRINITY_DN21089_c0_g1~~TRINITY_DN21089_c0_g1_i1.p1  ORF type:complete len:349 (+),score=64.89 TRINITY_DN21089_c0_g1_i1:86-1132(+)
MSDPCCGGGKRGGKKGGKGGKGKKGKNPTCFNCGEVGHTARDCIVVNAVLPDTRVVDEHERPAESEFGYVDTHCHIDYILEKAHLPTWGEFLGTVEMPVNFEAAISVFCDPAAILSDSVSSFPDLIASGRYPNIFGTVGLHPHNAKYYNDTIESRMLELMFNERIVGFGEIGLDATSENKGAPGFDVQMPVFEKQLQVAKNICPDKPIVIHYRGETKDLVDILHKNVPDTQKLHIHSWGGTDRDGVKALLDRYSDLYFGFTGQVTFKGQKTEKLKRLIAQDIPLDRILLETDSPYMLPNMLSPGKGKQPLCHPGHIPYIANTLATIKDTDIHTVYKACRQNTRMLYGI